MSACGGAIVPSYRLFIVMTIFYHGEIHPVLSVKLIPYPA